MSAWTPKAATNTTAAVPLNGGGPGAEYEITGLLLQRELQYLGGALQAPERPFVAILGGATLRGRLSAARRAGIGLVVGFAAKPVLGNLLAGLQIAMTQPIRLDDVEDHVRIALARRPEMNQARLSIERGDIEAAGLRAVVTKPVEPHELFGLLRTHLPAPRTH